MKLKKILAALSASLLVLTAAVPASAHGARPGNGQVNRQAAANVLGDTDQAALNRSVAHQCVGAAMASLGKLEEFQQERLRLKQEQLQSRTDGVCDGACGNIGGTGQGGGVCDGSGQGRGGGVCDGSGQGQGGGVCDGSGQGQGGGVCDGSGRGRGGGRGCRG